MKKKRLPRSLKKIGLTLIALGVLFLSTEAGLRWGADYYLRERAKIPVRIGQLFINPATSRVSLSFQGEKPGQELVLDLGAVRFDWWTILMKRLRLGHVAIDGLRLDVHKSTDGALTVGGIPLAAPPASAETSSTTTAAPFQGSHPWGIGVGGVDLHNVQLDYQDPQIALHILVHRFHMDPAESWFPFRATPFEADLDINSGRLLVTGTCRPFLADPSVEARIQLTNLPLDWLTGLAKSSGVTALTGILGITASTHAVYHKVSQGLSAGIDGLITLNNVRVAGPAVPISQVGFDGTFVFDGLKVDLAHPTPILQARGLELHNSRILLVDRKVHPAFRWDLAGLNVKLADIDSSDPASVVPFSISVQRGPYEKINLQGRWSPFAKVPDGRVEMKIDGLNLTAFTPYTQQFIGYRLATGLFDLKTKADVHQGLLQAGNGFIAHKLHLEKLHADELDESAKQIGLPLNLCLGLLRDADDNIRLDVPLSGDLRDPSVPVGHLVWQLLGKALASALRNAAMAFFPSGSKLGFDPIAFAPGQSALSPDAMAYLGKVGGKMAERPEVALKLSGIAGPADWYEVTRKKMPEKPEPLDPNKIKPEQKDKLTALAAQRADAVRNYLVSTFHLDPKRLLETASQFDVQPTSSPHAELSL